MTFFKFDSPYPSSGIGKVDIVESLEKIKMPNFEFLSNKFFDYYVIQKSLKVLKTINNVNVQKYLDTIEALLEKYASVMSEIRTDSGLAAPKDYTIQDLGNLLTGPKNLRQVSSLTPRINNAAMLARSLKIATGFNTQSESGSNRPNETASEGLKLRFFCITLDLDNIKEFNNESHEYGDIQIANQAAAIDRAHQRTTKVLVDKYRSEVLDLYPDCDIEILFTTQLYRAGGDEFDIISQLPTDLNGKNLANEFITLFNTNLELEFNKLGTRYSKVSPNSSRVDKPYTIKTPKVIWAPEKNTLTRLIFDNYCYCNGQVPSPQTINSISNQIASLNNHELTKAGIEEYFAQKKAIVKRLQGPIPENPAAIKSLTNEFKVQYPQFVSFFEDLAALKVTIGKLIEYLTTTHADIKYVQAADKILKPTDLDIQAKALELLKQFHSDNLLGQRVELYEMVKKIEQEGKISQIVAIELKTKPLNDIRFSIGSEAIKQSLVHCLNVMFGMAEIPAELQQFLLISRDGARNFFVLTKDFDDLEVNDPRRITIEESLRKLNSVNSFWLDADSQKLELPLGVGTYQYKQVVKKEKNVSKNGIDVAKELAEHNWTLGAISILSKIIKPDLFKAFVASLPEIIKNKNGDMTNFNTKLETQIWWNQMTNGRAKSFVKQILKYLSKSENQQDFIKAYTVLAQKEEFNDSLDYEMMGTLIIALVRWNFSLPLKLHNLKAKLAANWK